MVAVLARELPTGVDNSIEPVAALTVRFEIKDEKEQAAREIVTHVLHQTTTMID